jgi:hypothetical protein
VPALSSGATACPAPCFQPRASALLPAGNQVEQLAAWLEQAPIACEAPLLRALRSMPLPQAAPGRQAGTAKRLLAGPELEPLRLDGYRALVR